MYLPGNIISYEVESERSASVQTSRARGPAVGTATKKRGCTGKCIEIDSFQSRAWLVRDYFARKEGSRGRAPQ